MTDYKSINNFPNIPGTITKAGSSRRMYYFIIFQQPTIQQPTILVFTQTPVFRRLFWHRIFHQGSDDTQPAQ